MLGARLVALATLAVIAGCGTRAEDPRPPAYDDLQRIFDQSCGGATCHRSPTDLPPVSVDLAPGVSYQQLVGQPSRAAPARVLVAPGAPAQSYLLCTIDPTCDHRVGRPMPPTGPLSSATVEAVRRWIADGAHPDDSPTPPTDADDDTAPVFAGLESAIATGEHELALRWSPAFDRTPASRMRYRIYVATRAGGEDFSVAQLTVTAATTATVAGLAAGRRAFVVVRAVDGRDHEDGNRIERDATTTDVTAPEFGGAVDVAEPVPGTLEVSWLAAADNATPADALGYHVYLATQAGAEALGTPTTTVVGTTRATLVGLAPSTTYFVVVRAFDQAGNQDRNLIERSRTTRDTIAPSFAGLATATGAPSAALLTWPAATDDTTAAADLVYLVYRATTAGGQDLTAPSYVTPPGATSFAAGGLAPSRTYHFVVRARDRAGNVDGNLVQRAATTPLLVDVQAPSFAGATAAAPLSASTIRVSWSAGTDDVTLAGNLVYRVYRATIAGGQTFAAPTYVAGPGVTSFVATALAPSTPYFFVVRAVDQAGNQDGNLIEVSAATPADTTAPTFAGLSGAAAVNATSVALAWNPATDDITPAAAIVYDVYQSTTAGGESFASPTATTAAGATGLVVTGLAPLTTYHVVVRARDQAGNADGNLVERAATTTADVTPPLFAGATAAAPTALPAQLDVSWAAASDQVTAADHLTYLIYAATMSGLQVFGSPTAITAPGATSVRLTGLVASTTYFVVVRARDEAGNIDGNTVQVSAITGADTTRPTFAGLVTATAVNPVRARLAWAAAADDVTPPAALVYDVYVAPSAGGQNFAAPTVSSAPGATTVVVGGLTPATTAYVVVRARDQSGNRDGNTVERRVVLPPVTVSFGAQVQPIFTASCATANCHRGPLPAIGLDLSTAASSRLELIDVPSSQFVQVLRVAPGDANASYVMIKIRGAGENFEGDVMPPPPATTLTPANLATIFTWIEEGALDN